MKILWVIGEPGIGKTTMVRALLPKPWEVIDKPGWPKWTLAGPNAEVVAAGTYTGEVFDGADRVQYNGVMAYHRWWEENLFTRPLTVLDGDRFAFMKAVDAWAGHDRLCVYLEGRDYAAQRRIRRGTEQNATWVQGRHTKCENFVRAFPGPTARLLADQPPERLAAQVAAFVGLDAILGSS